MNKLLNELLDDQSRRWQSGQRHLVEQYLADEPTLAGDSEAVVDLIYHEFVLRSAREGRPDPEEYFQRFPCYRADLEPQFSFLNAVQSAAAKLTQAPRSARLTQIGDRQGKGRSIAAGDAAPAHWPHIDGFEISAELGRGSMGVVYKAWQPELQRDVALKMIHPARALDVRARARFRVEAESVARLQHPHIVQIFQIGEQEGCPYFAMEFVEGVTLEDTLAQGPMSARQAARLVELLARAVHYAHGRGIVHRDLKPANILLQARAADVCVDGASALESHDLASVDCEPKITDFSLARQLDGSGPHQTEAGVILGTPAYMAPEQAAGPATPVGPLADVYGLGAILYELLTGRPPFLADSDQETLLQAKSSEAVSPSRLQPRVSRDLDTVCLHCLEKEPGSRYRSALELAEDLARFLRGAAIKARPIGIPGRFWRFCVRHPGAAGSVLTLMLALTVGFIGTLSQWRRAEAALGNAEQNEVQAQGLLGDIIRSFGVVRRKEHLTVEQADLPRLFEVESQCAALLDKRHDDLTLRIALTRVRAGLADIHSDRGEFERADYYLHKARSLWDALARQEAGNPIYRIWLAITCNWQAFAAGGTGRYLDALAFAQRAEDLWLELNAAQPGDPTILQHAMENRRNLISLLDTKNARELLVPRLLEDERILCGLVRQDQDDRLLCQRLALMRLLLGEAYFKVRDVSAAVFYWRQAASLYGRLDPKRRDLLVQLPLANCCSQLIRGAPAARYYREALTAFGKATAELEKLVEQRPDSTWHQHMLLQTRLAVALCHRKMGEGDKAVQLYKSQLRELDRLLHARNIAPVEKVNMLKDLIDVAATLRGINRLEAALTVTRDAAVRAQTLARNPERDLKSSESLASRMLEIAALFCHVNHPSDAVPMARLGLQLFEELYKSAPEMQSYAHGLSAAWARAGKLRWNLELREPALEAFRQAAAIEEDVFKQAPALESNRILLSRCYDRLIYWYRLNGQRDRAVVALRERERLWPRDAAKLQEIAEVYRLLAISVEEGKGELGVGELTEIAEYVAERDRVERAAQALAGQTSAERTRVPTSDE
jgi:tetratricopeptide (TPR) repeat protein